MSFQQWINQYVSEKELDQEHRFEVQGPVWGLNSIPLGAVIEHAKITGKDEQQKIKSILVYLDFKAADPMDFFGHLAAGIAR